MGRLRSGFLRREKFVAPKKCFYRQIFRRHESGIIVVLKTVGRRQDEPGVKMALSFREKASAYSMPVTISPFPG
jgi:hypothetical protein